MFEADRQPRTQQRLGPQQSLQRGQIKLGAGEILRVNRELHLRAGLPFFCRAGLF